MDIVKSTTVKQNNQRITVISIMVIAVITLIWWSFSQPSAMEQVAKSQIWTGVVHQGNLALQVNGYGKLKSKEQRLLTAPANATVEEILLKPGSLVSKDSVIIRLSNPIISQQVKEAERNHKNAKTMYLQLELNQQRELLAHQAQQEQLMSQLELAELKMLAEENLVKKGIVSEINFKRSQLDFRQLSRRITIESKRLLQLNDVHKKELAIAQDKIEQQAEQVMVIQEQFNKLTVTAGINGVVQRVPVELGQSVSLGEKVALVGSVDSLYAMLNVSQADMDLIELEQEVSIDSHGGKITGKVQRINPLVKQGMITIEVTLIGNLPKNARPDLNVDGVISTGMLSNAFYIKKPVNASYGMQTTLFKLLPEQNQAQQVAVTYGHESGEFIQLVNNPVKNAQSTNNLQVNDRFILSDMSRWQTSEHITITQ